MHFKAFKGIYTFNRVLCYLGFQGVIIFKAIQYKPLTLEDYDYPEFGDLIGWLSVVGPIIIVPGWYIGYYCCHGGSKVRSFCHLAANNFKPEITATNGTRK